MTGDSLIERRLTRRAFILGGIQLTGFGVLGARLWYLQITQRDKYAVLAEENRIQTRLIAPPRGQILDRRGVPLATNVQSFQATLLPEQVESLPALLDRFETLIPLNDERRRIEREFKRRRGFAAILVRDNLSWDQVASLELHAPELPGLSIEAGEVRHYPFAEAAAHIVGFVGAPTESAQQNASGTADEALLDLPGFKLGKDGIEKSQDKALRGQAGTVQLEVNAHGRVVRELQKTPPKIGSAVGLTLDIDLQQLVQAKLAAQESAAAVVIDAQTGAVFALASSPAFDPNLFTFGIPAKDWNKLAADPRTPLHNKAVSGLYAPGSTFKTITALCALDSGAIDAAHTVNCPGYMDLGNHRFHCWRHDGHGTLDMVGALAYSCDVYFYDVAKRIGIDKLQAMAARFGLGEKPGFDAPGERAGLVPSRAWQMATRRVPWQQGETLIAAIGQGATLASPLQMAVQAARIASGRAVTAHVLKANTPGAAPFSPAPPLGIPEAQLNTIRAGMNAVCNRPGATAYGARISTPGFEMAGKTGSSQVRRISTAERASGVIPNERRPWIERDNALFIAYAPVHAPRYAIAVVVEHGGGGSKVAAPIARDILQAAQENNVAGSGTGAQSGAVTLNGTLIGSGADNRLKG